MGTPVLNEDKTVVLVGGRLPVKYMQDGNGFGVDKKYLYKVDANGVQIKTVKKAVKKTEDIDNG